MRNMVTRARSKTEKWSGYSVLKKVTPMMASEGRTKGKKGIKGYIHIGR